MNMSIFAWNMRGFNELRKQDAVRSWLRSLPTLPLFGCLLETRVLEDSFESISTYVFPGWGRIANYDYHRLGRIWFLWSNSVSVKVLYKGPQLMTFEITTPTGDILLCSAVYASNFQKDRRLLWEELSQNRLLFNGSMRPWIIMGDFNEILTSSEHSRSVAGSFPNRFAFQQMIQDCELYDLRQEGPFFTWWNNRKNDPIGKKLDRVLINNSWLQVFPASFVCYEASGISDHTRSTVYMSDPPMVKKIPFRFFNFLIDDDQFLSAVENQWNSSPALYHSRTALSKFSEKLKTLKPVLRHLNRSRYGSLPLKAKQAFDNLTLAQTSALNNPSEQTFQEVELATLEWQRLATAEEKFFQQKSRITWLSSGDGNTAFFHNTVRDRNSKSAISNLTSLTGQSLTTPNQIKSEAINYFSAFLQYQPDAVPIDEDYIKSLVTYRCPPSTATQLVAPITGKEIKEVLDSLPRNKATGPDGFTVEFFRAAWSIVGRDLVVAVQSYFHYFFMPRGTNATILALIPKINTPHTIKDFRPISCCNVIYKIISKLLANRLKIILSEAILPNQSAFIEDRLLIENILLATELVTDYHKSSTQPRCAIKLDVAKAFDTLRWDFILSILHAMALPELFVNWIQGCISTAAFSVMINGETDGFFNSSRGIRQGCSLSPYLFDIANNFLSLMLNKAATEGVFGYHPKCEEVFLTHLSFADDMLIFTDGTVRSLQGVMAVLKNYERVSGLAINPAKSSIFLGGTYLTETLDWIGFNGFLLENLPIRYLGLPLTTKSMSRQDYEPLIDRIRKRFHSWTTKFLSYGGRLQLIKSVIASIANFWCSVFRLPQRCLDHIESMCSAFLWSGSPEISTKSKVAWKDVCLPKEEGGLGIRRLKDVSLSFSLKLIWRLLTSEGSYWTVWTRHYLLRYTSFWDIKRHKKGSWIWNKLLKIRPLAASFIRYQIGTGNRTFFWLDNWLGSGSLISQIGEVGPSIMGINRKALVSDVARDGLWNIRYRRNPLVRDLVLHIQTLPPPRDDGSRDVIQWKHGPDLYFNNFSTKATWQQLRNCGVKKDWSKLIWSPLSIPRFSFIAWLAALDRLPTGARAARWGQSRPCPLCGEVWETRDHLFFSCSYTSAVWTQLISRLIDSTISPDWTSVTYALIRNRCTKEDNIILRWLFQASIYHLWRERNNRIHNNRSSPASALIRRIREQLSLRLCASDKADAPRMLILRTRWQELVMAL